MSSHENARYTDRLRSPSAFDRCIVRLLQTIFHFVSLVFSETISTYGDCADAQASKHQAWRLACGNFTFVTRFGTGERADARASQRTHESVNAVVLNRVTVGRLRTRCFYRCSWKIHPAKKHEISVRKRTCPYSSLARVQYGTTVPLSARCCTERNYRTV